MSTSAEGDILIRNTRPEDFDTIDRISRVIYPNDLPWSAKYLASTVRVFPEGQFVAVERKDGRVVGMSASLIIDWEDYGLYDSYQHVTAGGYFTNHDPEGRTLYGAEVMVDPARRRRGIGARLYAAREALVKRLGLLRIRAGARLPGYHLYADAMSAEAYVLAVIRGELRDPTLSFQLRQGFRVLAVVPGYYLRDPRGLHYAALIEWLNPEQAGPDDYARQDPRFRSAGRR